MSIIYARKAQNELFGHFIEFGWFNWSDIADNDCTKCFSNFDSGYRAWISDRLCIVNIMQKKESKTRANGP